MKTNNDGRTNYLLPLTICNCAVVALLTGLSIFFYDVSDRQPVEDEEAAPVSEPKAAYLLPAEPNAGVKYRLDDFRTAASRLGVIGYAANGVPDDETCLRAVHRYASRGVSIVISPSASFEECLNTAAENFPRVTFVAAYGDGLQKRANLITYKTQLHQIYHLAGIIAAHVTGGSEYLFAVQSLAGDDFRNVNAFVTGVRESRKDAVVRVVKLDGESEKANFDKLEEVFARHPDVKAMAAAYTDDTAADAFCESKIKYCVNYDRDFAGKYLLDSLVNAGVNLQGFYSRVISRILSRTAKSGNYLLGVGSGAVRFTNLNSALIPEQALKILDLEFNKFMIANDRVFAGPVYDNEHGLRIREGEILTDSPDGVFAMDWLAEGAVLEETGSEAESGSGTGAEPGAETGAGAEPGAGTETGAGAEPGAGTETGAGAEPGAGAETGAGAEPGAGAEAGAGAEPGAGAETGAGAEPGAGAETGAGTEPGAGAETGAGAEPGTGAETGTGAAAPGERSAPN